MTTEAPKAVAVADMKYTIELVTVDDTEEVLDFLRTFFFKVTIFLCFLKVGRILKLGCTIN